MVQHSSPEAGALRIASAAPTNASEAHHILHHHATDLMMAHSHTAHHHASNGEATTGNHLSITPISEVTKSATDGTKSASKEHHIHRNAEVSHRKPLDSHHSISELAKEGAITDNTKSFKPVEREHIREGKSPTVKVEFSDVTARKSETKVPPDFVVKKDGTISMNHNPEKTGQKNIVIEVERTAGQLKPGHNQQKSVDDLYKYLDTRIKQENSDAKQHGLRVDDPQSLVSPQAERATHARTHRQAPANFPPEAEAQTRRMQRFKGGGSGHMSHHEANDYFPERTVPRAKNENNHIAAMKDVVAGFSSKGDAHPYEHVSDRGARGFGVGRYGMGYDQISNWLSGLDIDGLEQLEEQGKVPEGTAAKMKVMKESVGKAEHSGKDSDLDPFLQKLKAGDKNNPVTASDLKQNFGKEVQELAADYTIGKYSEQMGHEKQNVQPGELAFAMMTGRIPSPDDLALPDNKRFFDAADQSYQIALNRFTNPHGPVDFADTGNMSQAMRDAVGKQLWRGYDGATQEGNLGCAITVSRILRAGGINIGDELSVDGVQAKMEKIGAQRASLNEAIQSGKPYVIIKKHGGSHTGIAIGDNVVENSSGRRETVSHKLSQSFLRTGSVAYILPTKA